MPVAERSLGWCVLRSEERGEDRKRMNATSVASTDALAPSHGSLAPPRRRARTPALLAILVGTAAAVSGTIYTLHAGREATDDAQIEGHVITVSTRVAGQVLRLAVEDNQLVNVGDVLFELDPADYAAKVEVAGADLAAAKAVVEGARAALSLTAKTAPSTLTEARGGMTAAVSSMTSAQATIAQANADLASAEARNSLAELNLKRARFLVGQGALPQVELDAKQTEFDQSQAADDQARARVASANASLVGSNGGIVLAKGRLGAADTTVEQVGAARAALDLAEARARQAEGALKLAELNLSYTKVLAPRRGVVSRRSVESGQTVSPERALLAIVPLDDVWVVGNFKEDQLAAMRPGESATVRFDTYGRREFHGHVESIAGGTGARFALLPPDNATGNFIKVVQRVPVLVRLDPVADAELRPGMSAEVTVDTRAR
jgi:membrane fusion protein, multidrug efflux system